MCIILFKIVLTLKLLSIIIALESKKEERKMTKEEIIKIIDSRLNLLNTLIAENIEFNLSYTLGYARAELEQLKIIIKYKEENQC